MNFLTNTSKKSPKILLKEVFVCFSILFYLFIFIHFYTCLVGQDVKLDAMLCLMPLFYQVERLGSLLLPEILSLFIFSFGFFTYLS